MSVRLFELLRITRHKYRIHINAVSAATTVFIHEII